MPRFMCLIYRCDTPVETCLARQRARMPRGGVVHPTCALGVCIQGHLVQQAHPDVQVPPWNSRRAGWREAASAIREQRRIEGLAAYLAGRQT